jgi:ABC-2 type transport system permease protein
MGGAFFTISVLPEWMQPIRYASIIGWAIEGWQEIQLRGGGVGDVLVPVAAMLGFAVLFFAVGSWRMGVRR